MLNDGLRLTDTAHARFYHTMGQQSIDTADIGKPHSIVMGTQPFATGELARNDVKSVAHELELQNGFARLDSAEHEGIYYECGIKNAAGEYIATGKLPGIRYEQSDGLYRAMTLSVVINPTLGEQERRYPVPKPPHTPTGRSIIHWGTGSGVQPRDIGSALIDEPPLASTGSIPITGIAVYAPLRIKLNTRLGLGMPLIRMPVCLSPGIYITINNYTRYLQHGD